MYKSSKLSLIIKHKPTSADERELIERCIKEDRKAQHLLFTKYSSKMLGVCYRYANNMQEAEDMLQEGFIKVFDNISKFRFEAGLTTWITRIMINTALNFLQKHNKIAWNNELEPVENMLEYSSDQLHAYDTRLVMDCIQQLSPGYKMVLNLYAIEGFSHKEIAEQLNIKEATSRSQYAKAKMQLMQALVNKGIEFKPNEAR